MTSKERFLTAMRPGGIPDRIPCTPDFSNYIPAKRTGLPFWEIYFENRKPLWRAYLETADYFGVDAWMASCAFVPLIFKDSRVETTVERAYDKARDAMIETTRYRTPDGDMTARSLCFRADPPSPIEKPIKDLALDFPKYKWLLQEPSGFDMTVIDEMRAACLASEQAFGLCLGYPGFQWWMNAVEGGVTPLAYAECDAPALLAEWHDLCLAVGTKTMELFLALKPDYVLFGGSGTITLGSPDLARKYCLPALKTWSAMAKRAGVPTMLHSCGKSRALVDMLCDDTNVDCINPLEIPPMGDVLLDEVKRARGRQISLMGNLHTTNVMLKGSPDDVRRAARQAMRDAGEGGGFILSTGDQCGRDTPEDNLLALVETAKEYGAYNRATGRLERFEEL